MENAEEVMHSLEEFSKLKPKDIPRELNDYLGYVAKTGDPVFKWSIIKCLFREKLLNVITDFYESTITIELPPCPNVDVFNYERMKANLLERIDSFNGAPFTVQRISELLTNPRKEYNRADKFMRAIEKNILVVSTREPGRNAETEMELPLDPSYNGLPYPKESIYDSICNDLNDPDSSGSYEAVVNSDPLKNETENVETQTIDLKEDDKPVIQDEKLESTQEDKDPETVICSTMTLHQEIHETNEVSETEKTQPEPVVLAEENPITLIVSEVPKPEPEQPEPEPKPQEDEVVEPLIEQSQLENEVVLDCSIHDEISSITDNIEQNDSKMEESEPKPEIVEDKVSSTETVEVNEVISKMDFESKEENEQSKEVEIELEQTDSLKTVSEADENSQREDSVIHTTNHEDTMEVQECQTTVLTDESNSKSDLNET